MFLDEARIYVISGRGGDGMVHFRREKYVPRGGPDGGDGGHGGDVILRADPVLNTLSPLHRRTRYKAQDGRPGGTSNKTGADGAPVMLGVPPGTLVRDEASGDLLGDLIEAGQTLVACRGGRGGRGNARFASARHQTPRLAERGEPGQERWMKLELRLIADVGIIGVPNAGKSTLLAALSNARPKIADYPFTTLEPQLGVVSLGGYESLVMADIPGLIEGAHRGRGLGDAFLRHIRRTRVLVHLIDGLGGDPLADYSQINAELALYDPELAAKSQIVAVNKFDQPEARRRWPQLQAAFQAMGIEPLAISALARQGLDELLQRVSAALAAAPPIETAEALPIFRPEADPNSFEIVRDDDGAWRILSPGVERAAEMTHWEYDEAIHRFQRLLERLGIEDALRQAGALAGDIVRIGEYELEWSD
jgi:GTP-binding protein